MTEYMAIILTVLLAMVPMAGNTMTSTSYEAQPIATEAPVAEETIAEPVILVEKPEGEVDTDAWVERFVSLWEEAHPDTLTYEAYQWDEKSVYPVVFTGTIDGLIELEFYYSSVGEDYWFTGVLDRSGLEDEYDDFMFDLVRIGLLAQWPDMAEEEIADIDAQLREAVAQQIAGEADEDTMSTFFYGDAYIGADYWPEWDEFEVYVSYY